MLRPTHEPGRSRTPFSERVRGAQVARFISILQSASNIPPRTNAALYRALALIPGLELADTPMKDAAGRTGITLTCSFQDRLSNRLYLFLDPYTYAYRGSRTDWRGVRDFSSFLAVVATGIVDHPGQVPGGELRSAHVPVKPR
ncbi:hypothetical protein ABZ615_23675 [Streptomyces sp. NPDC007325]|uniref:hypothetical protein n=1 Tax=Streptomyces sp. NPDC007325 TaxID=3154588 RepID=UPI0033E986B1